MDPITKELLNYGVLGVICVVLGLVVRFLYKENKADRHAAHGEREASRITLQGNTDVLHELKRILEKK